MSRVSVLIHNRNRAPCLRRCLASVATQDYRPLEVVVLDAGSTDESRQVIADESIRMEEAGIDIVRVDCDPLGVAASRNLAATHSTGDLLCAIDNDAEFLTSADISTAVESFKSTPRLAVLSFRVLMSDRVSLDPLAWVFRRPAERWSTTSFATFTFAGTGFCVDARAFGEVGGFWDHLEYAREEEELALALSDRGYRLFFHPGVAIVHHADPSGRMDLSQRRLTELRNGLLIYWRRLPLPFSLAGVGIRTLTMSIKAMRVGCTTGQVVASLFGAVQEWRRFNLRREPVRYSTVFRYAKLHLWS